MKRHLRPDTVIVFLGTNDCYDRTRTHVPDARLILDAVTSAGVNCVWVGNTAVQGKAWPVNGFLKSQMDHTCQYFDTEAADIELRDGIHPTRAGAEKWFGLEWPLVPEKADEAWLDEIDGGREALGR